MLRLARGQRRVLIERVPELANFAVGSLFFGQFLSDRPFSTRLAIGSIAVWILFIGGTLWLARREEQ